MRDRQYPLYHEELEHDSCGVGAVVDLNAKATHRTVDQALCIVERAKAVLMKREGLTEPEAHRSMQQYAMNHGMKMAEFAAQILAATKTTEE